MFSKRVIPLPLAAVSAVLIVLIAMLSVGSLWLLRQIQRQGTLHSATRNVIDTGRMLAYELANQGVVCSTDPSPRQWRKFALAVEAIQSLEPNLQFVSVTRDGVTVFHKQADRIDALHPPEPPGWGPTPHDLAAVRVSGRILDLGETQIPVMVFTRDIQLPDAVGVRVEVGLKRDAVTREEQLGTLAVTSMFRISIATILTAFGLCLVLISWLARREQRRERRRRQAEHLAFSGMLANGIAHDFRNPMSSVRLDAQMLSREAVRGQSASVERMRDLADRLAHTVERMDQVFREFFDLSQPRADRPEPVDVRACVKDCVQTLQGRIDQAKLNVQFEWPDLPMMLHTPPAPLRRALTNILLNAIQFSPPGETIQVRGSLRGERLTLTIADSGPGIPRKSRRKVMEMFYSTRPGGTGLGLFLARTAIENSGGVIDLLPNMGGGACIRLCWPLGKPDSRRGSLNSPSGAKPSV